MAQGHIAKDRLVFKPGAVSFQTLHLQPLTSPSAVVYIAFHVGGSFPFLSVCLCIAVSSLHTATSLHLMLNPINSSNWPHILVEKKNNKTLLVFNKRRLWLK